MHLVLGACLLTQHTDENIGRYFIRKQIVLILFAVLTNL